MKRLYDVLGACILTLSIILIVSQSGCNPVEATIGCPNVNKYESREGVYNANNFPIGRVLYLDSTSMQAFELGDVRIPNDSLKTTDTVKVVDQQVKVDFDFSFAGSVDQQLQGQIKAGLSILAAQEFNFTLYNVERRYIPNAIDWANADSALLSKIGDLHKHKPNLNIMVCFVSGLVYADSLRVKIADQSKLKSELKTKIANVDVEYSYSCSGRLFAGGKPSPLLWKAAIMDYDVSANKLVVHSGREIVMRDYNLNVAK